MNLKQALATGLVGAVLGLGPVIASAQEGPYFSVFWGRALADIDEGDLDQASLEAGASLGGRNTSGTSSLNDSDSAWGAQIGWRFNRWVAAEIGYVDLGKSNYVGQLSSVFAPAPATAPVTQYQVKQRFLSSGPTVAVLGMVPLGQRFDIYGRGGIYFADTRYRITLQFATSPDVESVEDKAGTQEFFGGFGFAWNINEDFMLRTEATYFNDVGDDDRTGEASVTMLTIGVGFR